MSHTVFIRPGREKSLLRHHPWIFTGAVARVEGEPESGETVEIRSAGGDLLGRGAYSPQSQIVCRVWSFNPEEAIDREFFARRIRRALELRRTLGLDQRDGGCRLIASEADGLPGLIADRYGDWLVVQILSTGTEFHRETLAEILLQETGCRGIYERSDLSIRSREGLPEREGNLCGEEPPPQIEILENGLRLLVDVRHGHKTGFYLDQRDNRRAVMDFAREGEVLNCFSYTGGFAAAALAAGAKHVTNVDSSHPALNIARENLLLNGIDESRFTNLDADVFTALRRFRDEKRQFDLIVLDPPKFVDSKGALPRGCRAYQDIARLAFQLLRSGGTLLTFSCSGLMTAELFQKITADAALDAKRNAVIVRHLAQAADHPTALPVPETFYLKGLVVKVD